MTIRNREVQTPLDLPYIKKLKWHLNFLGLWPDVSKPEATRSGSRPPIMAIVYLAIWMYYIITSFVFFKANFGTLSFFEKGTIFISNLFHMVGLGLSVTTCLKVYGVVWREFVHQIHLFNMRDKSEYDNKIYEKVIKISTIGTNIIIFQIHVGQALFNLSPLLDNYNSGLFSKYRPPNCTFKFPVEFYFPFDACNMYRYLFLALFNYITVYIGFACFSLYSLMICLIQFHVIGHLSILKHNLTNIPKPAGDMYTEEEEMKIKQLLIESINHHKMIVNFINKSLEAFGGLIFLYYSCDLYSGCIMLLELSEWDPVVFGKYLPVITLVLHQLMQVSFTFEFVNSGTEALSDAIYDVPWQYMGTSNRKIVYLILVQMQQPVEFKALGMVPVGVQTMAAILKGCFSYFLMLRTFAARE